MDKKTEAKAIELLVARKGDPSPTYAGIERKTGYSRRRPVRTSKQIDERGAEAAAEHGSTGRKPAATATEDGPRYLRESEKPYSSIAMAQSGGIFIEDAADSPDRRDDVERCGRAAHPVRGPMPRRGMPVRADGAPCDRFEDGGSRVLHPAVDDAATEVLAGRFMPLERMRGCARMTERTARRSGAPEAAYPDEHPVFRSARVTAATQLATTLDDLGARMIFANTPQAKGRAGRHGLTGRPRLANDVIRFGIEDHGRPDAWFNEFHIDCLNGKSSFPPAEPVSGSGPLPEDLDCSSVLRIGPTRTSRNGMIPCETGPYRMAGGNGGPCDPGGGVKVNLFIDVRTGEMYVGRCSRRYRCVLCGVREHKKAELVSNQKELQDLLKKMRK